MKVRRVDFYPDDWLAGVAKLNAVEVAVYITVCALIYSEGGPIERDDADLARRLRLRTPHVTRIVDVLKTMRKLSEDDAKLCCRRCVEELSRSRRRVVALTENGRRGGRPPSNDLKTNDTHKPAGFQQENQPDNQPVSSRAEQSAGSISPTVPPRGNGREKFYEQPVSDRLRAEGATLDQPAAPSISSQSTQPLDPTALPPEGWINPYGLDHNGQYRPMLPKWFGPNHPDNEPKQ